LHQNVLVLICWSVEWVRDCNEQNKEVEAPDVCDWIFGDGDGVDFGGGWKLDVCDDLNLPGGG
jgi:hypothetical protein